MSNVAFHTCRTYLHNIYIYDLYNDAFSWRFIVFFADSAMWFSLSQAKTTFYTIF